MKNIIIKTKNTFQEDWQKLLTDRFFYFEIHNNKKYNFILNIVLIFICIFEFFLIKNPVFKLLSCVLTLFVFILLSHFLEAYIFYIVKPKKTKKIENDIILLGEYIIELKKYLTNNNDEYLVELKKYLMNNNNDENHSMDFLFEIDLENKRISEKIKEYEVLLEQRELELKEKIKLQKEETILSKADKQNIQIIIDIIENLENQLIPKIFEDKITEIITLSKNILEYVKKDPYVFKHIIKTYNIYVNELCSVLTNIESLDSEDRKSYYNQIYFISDKLIEHLHNLIDSIIQSKKDNISLSLKLLEDELSDEKGGK